MEQMTIFLDVLLVWPNLVLALAVIGIIRSIRSMFPSFFKRPAVVRTLPFWPEILCAGLIHLPGVSMVPEFFPRLLVGIVVGMFSAKFYQIVKRMIKSIPNGNGLKLPPK